MCLPMCLYAASLAGLVERFLLAMDSATAVASNVIMMEIVRSLPTGARLHWLCWGSVTADCHNLTAFVPAPVEVR